MNDVTIQLPSVETCLIGGVAALALVFSVVAMVKARFRDRECIGKPMEFRELVAGVLLFFATVMFAGSVGTFYLLLFGYLGDNPYLWWVPVLNCVFGLIFVGFSAISKYA